jgi:hypothetical protein
MTHLSLNSILEAATLGKRLLDARDRLAIAEQALANVAYDASDEQVADAESAVARAKAFEASWKAEFTNAAFEMFSA